MKILAWIRPLTALLLVALIGGCAAEIVTQPEVRARVVAKTGQSVILYAGEAKDSAKLFCPEDILVVYRGQEKPHSVGRIRVTGYSGEHHLSGVVVEGTVAKGDLVKKGSVACTVQSAPAAGMEPEEMEPPKSK
jgi:hypothetical protein